MTKFLGGELGENSLKSDIPKHFSNKQATISTICSGVTFGVVSGIGTYVLLDTDYADSVYVVISAVSGGVLGLISMIPFDEYFYKKYRMSTIDSEIR